MDRVDSQPNPRWVAELVCLLAGGDITKKREIYLGYTLAECEPYLRFRRREMVFREAVCAFLGVPPEGEPQTPEDEYCRACREAGLADDCAACSKEIEVLNGQ